MFPGMESKEKQIGVDLGKAIIFIHEEKFREDVIKGLLNLHLSDTEFQRMIFCLYILEISMTVFWVQFTERDTKKSQEIIDNMFHHLGLFFSQPITRTRLEDYPKIVDFIIDPTERNLISSAIGQEINDFTRTAYSTLVLIVFDIRHPQYVEANKNNIREAFDEASKNRLFDPLTKLFIKHLTGKDALEVDFGDVTVLSVDLLTRFWAISAIIRELISGKTQT